MSSNDEHLAPLPDGTELAYRTIGSPSAPPILLLRPLGGSMTLWGELVSVLAQQLRVVTFDPRGVGRSSDVPLFYSTRRMARDAVVLLDHLEIERCHVFGLSLGGMVASWIALDHPERVLRVILASTLPEASALSARGLAKLARLAACFARPGVNAELALVHEILSAHFRRTQRQRLHEIECAVRATPSKRRNLASLALAAARHDAPVEKISGDVRVLLLNGALDSLAGRDARMELCQKLHNVKLEIIPDAGHDVSLEAPASTAHLILDFALESQVGEGIGWGMAKSAGE